MHSLFADCRKSKNAPIAGSRASILGVVEMDPPDPPLDIWGIHFSTCKSNIFGDHVCKWRVVLRRIDLREKWEIYAVSGELSFPFSLNGIRECFSSSSTRM